MMRDSARCAEELLFCMYRGKKEKERKKKNPKQNPVVVHNLFY